MTTVHTQHSTCEYKAITPKPTINPKISGLSCEDELFCPQMAGESTWCVCMMRSVTPQCDKLHTHHTTPLTCREYWLSVGWRRKVVRGPSPPTRPYRNTIWSIFAFGGVHSTNATVSDTSRTISWVGPSITAYRKRRKEAELSTVLLVALPTFPSIAALFFTWSIYCFQNVQSFSIWPDFLVGFQNIRRWRCHQQWFNMLNTI